MRSPEHILRHIVRCDWRCKHCGEIFGSERIAHYGAALPDIIKPTWFFASMSLLDHLRDCVRITPAPTSGSSGAEFSDELRSTYGEDFLNHPQIYDWYNVHALIERHFLAEEELD